MPLCGPCTKKPNEADTFDIALGQWEFSLLSRQSTHTPLIKSNLQISVILGVNSRTFITKSNKIQCKSMKRFFWGRKKCKSHHILRGRKQSQKSPYLDHEFLEVTKTKWDLKKFLSSIQIWLIPLVDDHQLSSAFFFLLCESVTNFSLCWVSIDEPNRQRALTFVRDYLGCGWRLLFYNLKIHPFCHFHHWLRNIEDDPIVQEHHKP
jgi:hypothetical protein